MSSLLKLLRNLLLDAALLEPSGALPLRPGWRRRPACGRRKRCCLGRAPVVACYQVEQPLMAPGLLPSPPHPPTPTPAGLLRVVRTRCATHSDSDERKLAQAVLRKWQPPEAAGGGSRPGSAQASQARTTPATASPWSRTWPISLIP